MDRTSVSTRGISTSSDSDYSESRFEAESILPAQFFEGRKKNEALELVKRLMLAVFTDAVRCYQIGFGSQKTTRIRAFREAEEWLFSAKGYGHSRTCATPLILLPTIFARRCVNGGSEGFAELASQSSVDLRR
jgi:hypothetical protein